MSGSLLFTEWNGAVKLIRIRLKTPDLKQICSGNLRCSIRGICIIYRIWAIWFIVVKVLSLRILNRSLCSFLCKRIRKFFSSLFSIGQIVLLPIKTEQTFFFFLHLGQNLTGAIKQYSWCCLKLWAAVAGKHRADIFYRSGLDVPLDHSISVRILMVGCIVEQD